VEALASGTSKFRRLLDEDSFCFNRFVHDRSSSLVMVMRVRDNRRSWEQSTCHGKIRERVNIVFDTLLRRKGEYHVYFHTAPLLNEIWIQFLPKAVKLYVRTSHSPDLPNVVCGTFPYILLSFVLFINDTSPYLDLSVVYGHNQATHTVRDRSKGRGLLYPDAFVEERLLFLPLPSPSSSCSRGTTTSPFSRLRSPPLIPSWRRNRTRKSSGRQD